jgi:mersacidin/lichenicidin family type 2 lantibiotic
MNLDIVRAWKDEDYRNCLSEDQLLSLPENPVGEIELADDELEAVYGGYHHWHEFRIDSAVCGSQHCSGICVSNGCIIILSGGCSHAEFCIGFPLP